MNSLDLWNMEPVEINRLAVHKLVKLLNISTMGLIERLTGITRQTQYRWLDESRSYDQMDYHKAAWFILMLETKPQLILLQDRAPSRPHLAHRIINEEEDA